MTQHTNFFSTRLDALQQRAHGRGVQTAVDETDAQLVERINSAQADLDQSVKNAKQETSEAADGAKAKWAQLAAAAKRSEAKANMDKRELHLDAKVAATDANWAEADAAEASTSPTGRSATHSCPSWTLSTPAPTPTGSRPRTPSGPTELVHHAQLSLNRIAPPRAGRPNALPARVSKGKCNDNQFEDPGREDPGPAARHHPRRCPRGVGGVGVIVAGCPMDRLRHVRAVVPDRQPGRSGLADRRGVPVRRHPAWWPPANPRCAG